MKKMTWLGSLICLFVYTASPAGASWLVDLNRFAASVHGETTCQECHESIAEKDLHPDPSNMGRSATRSFSPDMCAGCHDETIDNINDGSHGTKIVKEPERWQNCLKCHDPHYQLPPGQKTIDISTGSEPEFSEEDQACRSCHGVYDAGFGETTRSMEAVCFHCHANDGTEAQLVTAKTVGLIDKDAYRDVPHAALDCLVCHTEAAGDAHNRQPAPDCGSCHKLHDEKTAHDLHTNVACQSCHLQDIIPVRNDSTGHVSWKSKRLIGSPLRIHTMSHTADTSSCRTCHNRDSSVRAAAMVLPAKSLICMPCHTATLSIGDTTTLLSLGIFLIGMLSLFAYVLSGSLPGSNESGLIPKFFVLVGGGIKMVFSSKCGIILRALVFDVLLQRRLYRQSASRWLIHSMIFFPFVFRFCWGMLGLLASLVNPENPLRFMLEKNHPATGFLYDLSGIILLAGIVLAFVRGFRRTERLSGLPDQDRIALSLIGAIVLIGFILEGLRIAMTGFPAGSAFAVIGFALGRIFGGGAVIGNFYGYIWYLHAIITGAFIAYLPFSRLLHIIMAPFILAMHAIRTTEHDSH